MTAPKQQLLLWCCDYITGFGLGCGYAYAGENIPKRGVSNKSTNIVYVYKA